MITVLKKLLIYKIIILPVVLYGYETWAVTLKRMQRLKLFENRMVREIFGLKMDEIAGGWRKLNSEKLRNICSSPNVIRMIKLRSMSWTGYVTRMGERRNAYRILLGKPEVKSPLGRPRRK
jgi:hypothetical protein